MPHPLNVQYRLATRMDVHVLVRLLAEDELGAQRERFESPLPESYYKAFEAIDADPNNELIVAHANGEIVGTLQLMFLPHLSHQGGMRAQISSVRVAEKYRGQGIGTDMMKWTLERARERGCHLMQLTSNRSRTDAHRFYEKLGFEKTNVGMKIKL